MEINIRQKPEGKRPLERPRRRWKNYKIYLKNRVWRCRLDLYGSGWGPV